MSDHSLAMDAKEYEVIMFLGKKRWQEDAVSPEKPQEGLKSTNWAKYLKLKLLK